MMTEMRGVDPNTLRPTRFSTTLSALRLFIVIVGSLLLWPVYYLEFDMRIYWGLTISLVVLFAAFAVFWPPTEYVAFKWKTGVTALSVGRRGRDKTRFDEFVVAIQQAILARSTG